MGSYPRMSDHQPLTPDPTPSTPKGWSALSLLGLLVGFVAAIVILRVINGAVSSPLPNWALAVLGIVFWVASSLVWQAVVARPINGRRRR